MSVEYNKLMLKFEEENNKINMNYIDNIYQVLEQDNVDKLLLDNINNLSNGDYWIIELVNNFFDLTIPEKMKEQFVNRLESEGIKVIKYNKKNLIIEYNSKQINIGNLCSSFRQFDKRYYNANTTYYSKDVYIPILLDKMNDINYESKIVIGYIKEEVLESKKLFAWIEITKKGKVYVLDFVNNIVIDKDSFYIFYKPEILNVIEKDDVISDDILSVLINNFDIQYDEYLIFNKEFNKDITKIKSYF